MSEKIAFNDRMIELSDGLQINVRQYLGGDAVPAFCIHGLTRNAADFADFAPMLAATGRDVYAISLRGRGKSGYDADPEHYHPLVYRDDVLEALDALALPQALFVGTSLGGITTMLIAEKAPERIKAAIINDIGPEIALEGLQRLATYVGKTIGSGATLDDATQYIREINEIAFPNESEDFWRTLATRTFRKGEMGWHLDYDPNISQTTTPFPDLWPGWRALKDIPTLLVHGETSDLLTAPIIEKMRAAHPKMDYACVNGIGHAPFLTEPDAWAAIKTFAQSQ